LPDDPYVHAGAHAEPGRARPSTYASCRPTCRNAHACHACGPASKPSHPHIRRINDPAGPLLAPPGMHGSGAWPVPSMQAGMGLMQPGLTAPPYMAPMPGAPGTYIPCCMPYPAGGAAVYMGAYPPHRAHVPPAATKPAALDTPPPRCDHDTFKLYVGNVAVHCSVQVPSHGCFERTWGESSAACILGPMAPHCAKCSCCFALSPMASE
jgi:hypothetical protein